MIRGRVNSGLARTKANGGKRKDGARSANEVRWGTSTAEMEKRSQALRNAGKGIWKIGRELGVGTALAQRVLVCQCRLAPLPTASVSSSTKPCLATAASRCASLLLG